jgi:putative salt-induced outer membrane protein
LKKIVLISLAAAASLLGAETVDNSLKTHTELSYVQTDGNTETTAFALDFAGEKVWDAHKLKLDLDALYGEDNDVETKNKVLGELNYDYQFAEHLAFNYILGYKMDKFSGFDYQLYTGPGLKYIALNSDAHKLNLQANVLYSEDKTMKKYYDANGDEIVYPYPDGKGDAVSSDPSVTDDYTGYVLKGDYTWQIMENLKFLQEASYRGDFEESERYFVYSKSAIESKINSMLSFGLSYKVDYTNVPPAGNERTDTTFMTSLIIDY